MPLAVADFFEELRRQSTQAPKHNNPHRHDAVELALREYFSINPYQLVLRSAFKQWFDQFEKVSPRCREDLFYVAVYFFPWCKNYHKLLVIDMLTVVLIELDDIPQLDRQFLTDEIVSAVRNLTHKPDFPATVREFIRRLDEFVSGTEPFIRDGYIDIMGDFVEECHNEVREVGATENRLSWTYQEYVDDRKDVILLRMYMYALWILHDTFTREEFMRMEGLFRDVDEWGILMNDYLSIWKELEDQDTGNWIILTCWQTGATFEEGQAVLYEMLVSKTYEVIGKLKTYDALHNTSIGKHILVFMAGIYLWNKYSQRYRVEYLGDLQTR